jgi:very-short-patch-repair endonuclease
VDASGHPDLCQNCGAVLPTPIPELFRLQNVSTKRRDRINSDEEERLRMGYEVCSAIRFSEHGGKVSRRTAQVTSAEEELLSLTYGHGATLWRINMGWRRRANPGLRGFVLDMERGYWERNSQMAEDDKDDPFSHQSKRVIPFVEDWRNSLLIAPATQLSTAAMASLQAALKNAIQAVYQLEDNEIAAEPLPTPTDRRLILLYESAEGGAGVLRRLLDEPDALPAVAREALSICHFDPETGVDQKRSTGMSEDCEAACYNCLMSYANQPDHKNLDRKSIRDLLLKMATSQVNASPAQASREEHLEQLKRLAGSKLETQWLDFIEQHKLRLPVSAQVVIESCHTQPDFMYENSVAVYIDGPPHDYPDRQQRDAQKTLNVQDAGYLVIRFHHADDWMKIVKDHPNIFGTPK